MRKKLKKVLVFGVFDLFHPGHNSFLRQARRHGGELIVVVARASSVFHIKGQRPHESDSVRVRKISKAPEVKKAVLGDAKQGAYRALFKCKPDVICCGYDQHGLYADLKKRMAKGEIPRAKLVRLRAYRPKHFKSSIERKKIL
ncbi:MAG: adenylyltransferase/cytidyltransferase family protein [Patescibacteria group bacterium]